MKESKYKSRTFWFASLWSLFVPMGIFGSIYMSKAGIDAGSWLTALITSSGVIVTAFIAGEKARKAFREKNERSVSQPSNTG